MVKFVEGNFFDFEADIRVNTVNCVGAMGAGVALLFKNMFPEMYKEYSKVCRDNWLKPGRLHIWHGFHDNKPIIVINFPTKIDWKNPSEYSFIEKGLKTLKEFLNSQDNMTVTLPALGCGHGGLDWSIVKKLIKNELGDLKCNILVFEPKSSTSIVKENNELALQEKGIKVIYPNEDDIPLNIRGKLSRKFFYKGNFKLLHNVIINLIVSSQPNDRERLAMESILNELLKTTNTFILKGDSSYELELGIKILKNNQNLILLPTQGLLEYKARKDILEYINKSSLLILSNLENQKENWRSFNFINNLRISFKLSKISIVNIFEIEKLEQSAKYFEKNGSYFYVNYWTEKVKFIENSDFNKIGRNSYNKPNVNKILELIEN